MFNDPAIQAALNNPDAGPLSQSIQENGQGNDPVDLFAKAKKCQEKGGVWINDICQLKVE